MVKSQLVGSFGLRLRHARRLKGIPQDKLGVAIGLDEGSASARMSRYETGVHEPPYAIAVRLAEVLDIPAAFFYCEDDQLGSLLLIWNQLTEHHRQELLAIARADPATFK